MGLMKSKEVSTKLSDVFPNVVTKHESELNTKEKEQLRLIKLMAATITLSKDEKKETSPKTNETVITIQKIPQNMKIKKIIKKPRKMYETTRKSTRERKSGFHDDCIYYLKKKKKHLK
jgi:hypothetical protein